METKNKNQVRGSASDKGAGFWHLFGRAALSVLLGIGLAFILPTRFGEEMGAQTMARYAAPFSGYLFDREREQAVEHARKEWHDKDITVLVIDREALDGCGEGWPAHYPFYSWLLKYLNKYPPKGVFIDVILSQSKEQNSRDQNASEQKQTACLGEFAKTTHQNEGAEETDFSRFKKSVMALTSKDIPVFLAARRKKENTLATNPDFDTDDELKSLRRVGIEFSAHSVDRLAWTYPLVYPNKKESDSKAPGAERIADSVPERPDASTENCPRSAAFAIFQDVYKGKLVVPCDEAALMSVTWPLDTAAYGLHWFESRDEESEERHRFWPRVDNGDGDKEMYCTSSASEYTLMWRAEMRAFLRPVSRPLCVHYRTIHASQLPMGNDGELNEAAAKDGELSDPELNEAFRDRFVMIGTAFAYSNDLILSPLQDRIPGVFLHAAALDNLLSHHQSLEDIEAWELKFNMSAARWGRLLPLGVLGFLGIFMIVTVKKKVREKFADFHQERTHWRKRFHAHWWRAKLFTAGFNVALAVVSLFVLVLFGVVMIVLGASIHVPFLVVAHVLACTIAVEWFEWSEHLFNWITDSKEK